MTLLSSSGPTAGGLGRRIATLHQAAHDLWIRRHDPRAGSGGAEDYLGAVISLAGWLLALHAGGAADEPHLAPSLEAATEAAEAVVAAEAAGAGPSRSELSALLGGIDRLEAALKARRRGCGGSLLIEE